MVKLEVSSLSRYCYFLYRSSYSGWIPEIGSSSDPIRIQIQLYISLIFLYVSSQRDLPLASREVEWTSPLGTYSDESLTFFLQNLPLHTYLYFIYSFSISRGEYHFHNYPEWIPVSRSYKKTQSTHYNDRLLECIGGGQSLMREKLGESVCPQVLTSF